MEKLEAWPLHFPPYLQIGKQQSGRRQGPAADSDLSFKGWKETLDVHLTTSLQDNTPSRG